MSTTSNGVISSEGVQRDLLPLIEGSQVSTKHGNVNTDHILFVASGAFHTCKPSDLLAELQGRLPVRVVSAARSPECRRSPGGLRPCRVKRYSRDRGLPRESLQ